MRMKFSIRYKFTIGFLLIFCLCFTFITIFINNIVMVNNEKVISNELLSSQTDINTYLKQFLMINSIKSNSGEFEKKSSDIGAALSSKLNTRIVLYKKDGSLLLDTDNNNGNMFSDSGKLITDSFMDLKSAVKGQSAYNIVELDKTYKVIFSEPLYIDKTTLGVLRYTVDYTELFQNGNNIVIKLKVFMLFMFFILFIFSILLSTKIIIPIIKLNKSTKEISNGNFNIDVLIESNDEIGELGQSFKIMKGKIKEQIETIKKDRDGLIKLEGHRKVFFDNATHEMKTPLTIIDGYAQMILDECNADEKLIIRAASKIKSQSNKLNQVIVDILDMSKFESEGNMLLKEKFNMAPIVNSICGDMSVKAKKYEIIIEKSLDQNIYIFANRDDIWRMLVNIIDNSIKYGNVKAVIRVNLFKDNDYCNITVEDEGKGINKEALQMIFEPFYRVDKNNSSKMHGNGLGLSIVKAIVEKYKGSINITSKTNQGTKVYIKIPLLLQVGNKLIE